MTNYITQLFVVVVFPRRSGDVVVQFVQEHGHQQYLGQTPAQETIRGESPY